MAGEDEPSALPAFEEAEGETARERRKREGPLVSMARRALEREIVTGGPDFAALAQRHRGMFRGPRDLSTREGYGR